MLVLHNVQGLIENLNFFGEVRQPGFKITIEGGKYRIEKTCYPFNPHFLSIANTNEERLQKHWDGYRENNLHNPGKPCIMSLSG